MSSVLVIRSAATGAASVSNRLIDSYLATLQGATVTERDLDADPVPHVTSASLAGIGREAPEGALFQATRDLADRLIAEVFAADTIVIGLPLYNFGLPSTLKAWFDYVLRAGTTFRYTPQGPEGLVKGKRAVVVHSRAGKYDESANVALGLPHLTILLNFMGVTDITTVTAEGLAFGPDAAAAAIAGAEQELAALG